jgi:hypothetical protein
MQDLYTALFGNNCTIIATIKKLKTIAAKRARKFEKFKQTATWPASTGNLILYAVDQGVRNMFNQKIHWASGQAGIRVQNQAFEQFATLLESGIQMESSLLPPLLQPRDPPKTSTQTIPDTTGKRQGTPQLSQDKKRLKLEDLPPATIKLDEDHAAALQHCYDVADALPRNSPDKFSTFNLRRLLGNCPSMDHFLTAMGLPTNICARGSLFGICTSQECLKANTRTHLKFLPNSFKKGKFIALLNKYSKKGY